MIAPPLFLILCTGLKYTCALDINPIEFDEVYSIFSANAKIRSRLIVKLSVTKTC